VSHLFLRHSASVFVLSLCSVVASAQHPHERSGLVTGVGIGRGETELTIADDGNPDTPAKGRVEGYAPHASIGYGFGNHFVILFENKQWVDEQGLDDLKLRVNTQHFSFALMYAPFNHESMAGGLYLQGGVGWANSRFTALEPIPEEEQEFGETYEPIVKLDDDGVAYSLGVGYEIRVLPPVAVGMAISYNYLDNGGLLFKESYFIPMTWTLNWYW